MSSDDNEWRSHICTCAVFATTSFNFGLPTYIVSHFCYGWALYAVFYRRFFFQSRAELFDCGVANDMSKVTHLLVCIVLTPSFCFASSVCFDSFKNLILSGFARDWCYFPSRRLPCISICLSIVLFSWDRCLRLSLSLLTLFVIWHSGTTWFKYINAHAKSPLTISCVLCAAMA